MTQVSRVKENWFNSVALTDQSRTLLKEQLRLWRTYKYGLKLLWKLVRDVEPLLPPTGPAPCTLDDYQVSLKFLLPAFSIETHFEVKGHRNDVNYVIIS